MARFASVLRGTLADRLLQRLRQKPDPENRLAGFVQHIQSPFGIIRQTGDDIPCQIGVDSERRFARGTIVAEDIFEREWVGKFALLDLETEARHLPS